MRATSEEPEEQAKPSLNKKSLKILSGIFRFILPYKYYFAGGMISLILSSITLLAFPYVAGKLIDVASGNTHWLFESIDKIALGLIMILFVQGCFSFLRVFLFAKVSENAMADVRKNLYKKMIALPVSFYDQRRTGELISRITADVSLLQSTFSTTLAEFFRQISTLVIGTLVIFFITPNLTVFMLATFPVLILIAVAFGRFIRKLSKKTQDELATANVIVEETLQSIHAVKAFTSELYEYLRYRSSLNNVVKIALKAAKLRGVFISFIIFALFGAIVGVMWYGATLVQSGVLTVGSLLSFVLYTTFIGGSIAGLGDVYGQIQRAIGASERILEIMKQQEETVKPIDVQSGEVAPSLHGNIVFDNVWFAYPTRKDVDVLQGIQFKIKKGEKVALVGHSGAGKSTIIQLLLRYYHPAHGDITIHDQSIHKMDLRSYRRQIGIVPQEVILFGGTIRENIAYGKLDASHEEIITAAKKANAFDFINSFPEGFETMVGERGVKLSGGQRQRIAIARAILKDPAILVLDEATSSLDAASEKLVQDALDELMKNRTTIIIAHRLATIRKVDNIFVLNKGTIIESGTHEELSAMHEGTYSNLIKLQLETTQDA